LIIDRNYTTSREDLLSYYDSADIVLYPSRFEGFGLSLLEAIHRGCVVFVTDGEPMTDLVPTFWPKVGAVQSGFLRLAPTYEPDAASLAELIGSFIARPEDLSTDVSQIYLRRQRLFREQLDSLVRVFASNA
jgi:glycosyltransferase involved in cell wall biosynthesis